MSGEPFDVAVRGGRLHGERWAPGAAGRAGTANVADAVPVVPVIAAHGLTSHRGAWHETAARLPELDLTAVDLRGRGDSRDLPGPSSIAQHADDLLAVADALGAERVVVAGHSMGAFVAVAFVGRHPDRTAALGLVDGGLTLPRAGGANAQPAVADDLEGALARLRRTFASREDYHELWRQNPAIGEHWSPAGERYVDGDLHGAEPQLRPAADADRVREDMLDMFAAEVAGGPDPIDRVQRPAIVLRAQRGLLDQPEGLYPEGWLQRIAADHHGLEVREVADVNHYTVLLHARGADQVAAAIRDAVDGASAATAPAPQSTGRGATR